MIYSSRRIFKTAQTGQNEVKELLQFMFVGEILSPGGNIWLVTPWISNVPILDNRADSFKSLDPSWGQRVICLSEIITRLLGLGSEVIIVTRPDEHCKQFILRLKETMDECGVKSKLRVIFREELHIKGFLTETGLLTGSMNLTHNGLDLLDEQVTFDTDLKDIAEARINFEAYLK